MQYRKNTDAGGRKITRWASGPSFQTALNIQGVPATFQVRVSGQLETGTFSRSSVQVMATSHSRDTASLLHRQLLREGQKVQMGNKVLK